MPFNVSRVFMGGVFPFLEPACRTLPVQRMLRKALMSQVSILVS